MNISQYKAIVVVKVQEFSKHVKHTNLCMPRCIMYEDIVEKRHDYYKVLFCFFKNRVCVLQ